MKSTVIRKNNLINVVFMLAICSSLYLFENRIISMVGALCAVGALLACAFTLLNKARKIFAGFSLSIFIIMLIFFAFQIIKYRRVKSFYQIAQIIGFLILSIVLGKTQLGEYKIRSWKHFIRVFYYSVMAIYFFFFLIDEIEFLYEIVSPTLLKILFPLSWFAIKRNAKTTPIEIFIFLIFHFLLGERTAVLCMVIVLGFQFILRRMKNKTSNFLFVVVVICAVIFPFVYLWLYNHPIGQIINEYIYARTGENFFSGRNRIWSVIINGLANNQILGVGFGNSLLANNGITMSTHNLYMYLYLNGGFCLILLFLLFMFSIWKNIPHRKNGETSIIVGKAYILGMFIFLDFELFLLSNNIVISLIWWLTIAFIQIESRSVKKRSLGISR